MEMFEKPLAQGFSLCYNLTVVTKKHAFRFDGGVLKEISVRANRVFNAVLAEKEERKNQTKWR